MMVRTVRYLASSALSVRPRSLVDVLDTCAAQRADSKQRGGMQKKEGTLLGIAIQSTDEAAILPSVPPWATLFRLGAPLHGAVHTPSTYLPPRICLPLSPPSRSSQIPRFPTSQAPHISGFRVASGASIQVWTQHRRLPPLRSLAAATHRGPSVNIRAAHAPRPLPLQSETANCRAGSEWAPTGALGRRVDRRLGPSWQRRRRTNCAAALPPIRQAPSYRRICTQEGREGGSGTALGPLDPSVPHLGPLRRFPACPADYQVGGLLPHAYP